MARRLTERGKKIASVKKKNKNSESGKAKKLAARIPSSNSRIHLAFSRRVASRHLGKVGFRFVA
jgi:hypothetical protein